MHLAASPFFLEIKKAAVQPKQNSCLGIKCPKRSRD